MLGLKFAVLQCLRFWGLMHHRGEHWGVLETAKTEEKIIENRKTAKKSAKTENRIQNRQKTDTMLTSAAYRANYTNTLFHQSICECHGLA